MDGGIETDKEQLITNEEEITILNEKIKKLNKNIGKVKKLSVAASVFGAAITTIFSVINILVPAIVSFIATVLIVFLIDFIKMIFSVLLWRNNNKRSEIVASRSN